MQARRARVRFVRCPRPGGDRLLSILDPAGDAAYARAVAAVVPAVERSLGPEVMANRVAWASLVPPSVVLRAWPAERRSFLDRGRRLRSTGPLLVTDVAACYASIRPPAVANALERCGTTPADVLRCVGLLEDLADLGVPGLPVGPTPSAVLANAVLRVGDEALRAAGLAFARWVDDWWISVPSDRQVERALAGLADALDRAGLALNPAKTRVLGAGDGEPDPSHAGEQYHRAADAHPVPGLPRPDAVVPGDGGVGPGR